MKTFLTIIGVIVGIIVITLGGIAIYAKNWWDDVTFKPDIQGIKNKIPSILLSLVTNQKIPVSILVDNNNASGLIVKDLQIKGSYQGKQVFESGVIPVVEIPANTNNTVINGELMLFANSSTVKLANDILSNKNPIVQLTVSLSKFGLTRSFTFDYKIEP